MIRSWPLLFIVIPLVELYVIITVGGMIGAFWTVILVLLTAVIGVNLLRMQGMSTLMRAQQNMAQGSIPAMEMMEGIALAGCSSHRDLLPIASAFYSCFPPAVRPLSGISWQDLPCRPALADNPGSGSLAISSRNPGQNRLLQSNRR